MSNEKKYNKSDIDSIQLVENSPPEHAGNQIAECCSDLPSPFLSPVRTFQSPLGTMGCPRDSCVPPETTQSHCPSHQVPLGLWDVLGTPVSHQKCHIPSVLPIPKSPWDYGMSSGLPCPTRNVTVPLSFPSSLLGTMGCPRNSCVPMWFNAVKPS